MSDETVFCEHGIDFEGEYTCLLCHPELVTEVTEASEASEVTEGLESSEDVHILNRDFSKSFLSDPFIKMLKLRVARRKIQVLREMI